MTQSETKIVVKDLEVDTEEPILLTSFPGIGLVGTIATAHIITEYNLKSVGYIDSKKLPPVSTLLDGVAVPPIRIYQIKDKNLLLLHSDVPIKEEIANELVQKIINWALSNKVRRIYSLAGVATFDNQNRVFGAATKSELLDEFKEHAEVFQTGTITGVAGSLLNECVMQDFPGLILLGETFGSNPDPRAAAKLIEALNGLFDLKVDTERLIEEAEFVEAQMARLAEQTQNEEKEATREEFPMFG